MFAKGLINILILIIILACSDATFTKVSPVLWRKSDRPVISGINKVVLNIKYSSPCDIFKDEMLPDLNKDELELWCNEAYKDDFLKPLKRFCQMETTKANTEIRFHREKRFIFEAFLLATVIITVITTIGVSSSSMSQSSKNAAEIADIKQKQQELFDAQNTFQENQHRIKNILEKLQTEVNEIDLAVKDLSDSLKSMQKTIPRALHIVANLAAMLLITKERLFDVGRKWKKGIVDEKLLGLFNITLPYDCDLSLAKPKHC